MSFKVTVEHADAFLTSWRTYHGGVVRLADCRESLQNFVDELDLMPGLRPSQISAGVAEYNKAYNGVVKKYPSGSVDVVAFDAREAGVDAFLKSTKESGGTIREPKIVGKTSDAVVVDDPIGLGDPMSREKLALFREEYFRMHPIQSAPVVTAKGEPFRAGDFATKPTDITAMAVGDHVVASRPVVVVDPAGPESLPLFKGEFLRTSPAPSGWIYFRRIGNQTLGIDISKIAVFEIDAEGCFNVETNDGGIYEVAEADRDIVLSHLMAALNVKDLTGGVE